MAVAPGTRIGPYEIAAQIGAGGMGEVYRATDTKLKRQVAIKVLPASVAGDPERLARFQREAEVLAKLNHPNIAAIYGLQDTPDAKALVMELVEGPTLADRIAPAAIPVDEALPIARQIAEALEAAHDQGIVHRDLKPANIKVRPDGTVKVLDFGLAKAMEAEGAPSSANVSQLLTITTPAMTQAGVILGTAAYMSPEQARGRAVDRRADIWAFGCVVYEMLTGRRPFASDEVSDTLALVLTKEPDWSILPAATPASIRLLLRRCLEKNASARLPHIGAARLELVEVKPGSDASPEPVPSWSWRIALGAAAVSALVVATAAYTIWPAPAAVPSLRFTITPPEGSFGQITPIAVAPEGTRIAYFAQVAAARQGSSQNLLVVHDLRGGASQTFQATLGGSSPFWSPDGRFVAFFTGGQLKRLEIATGAVRTISDAPMQPVGGSWNREGVILIGSAEGPLARVAAEGGTPSAVTTLRGANGHTYPEFLPDGRHFLFLAIAAGGTRSVAMSTLDDDTVVDLGPSESKATYAAPYLLRVSNGELIANRFDIGSRTLAEERIVLTNGIAGNPNGTATFAISGGTLAYRRTVRASLTQLTWVDRTGSRLGTVGDPDDQMQIHLSPDGTRAAVSVFDSQKTTRDVWMYDLTRNVRSRFTFEDGDAFSFVWSPDGAQLLYSAVRPPSSLADLFIRPVDGAGAERRVLDQPGTGNRYVQAWSSASGSVLFGTGSAGSATGNDIWIVSLDGKAPRALVQTPFNERAGSLSPDGRWLAYESNESGRFGIYVRAIDGTRKWLVSSGDGTWPRWRRDGRELFYLDSSGALVSVPVILRGSTFESALPTKLFEARLRTEGYKAFASGYSYDVSPDGSRFLLNQVVGDPDPANITVTTNWTDSLLH